MSYNQLNPGASTQFYGGDNTWKDFVGVQQSMVGQVESTWITLAGGSGTGYYKDATGRVSFSGAVRALDPPGNDIITLPVGYRPSQNQLFRVCATNSGLTADNGDVTIKVTTAGLMTVVGSAPTTDYLYFLSSISYYAA